MMEKVLFFLSFLLIISVQKIPISPYVLSHEWTAVSLTPTQDETSQLPCHLQTLLCGFQQNLNCFSLLSIT